MEGDGGGDEEGERRGGGKSAEKDMGAGNWNEIPNIKSVI